MGICTPKRNILLTFASFVVAIDCVTFTAPLLLIVYAIDNFAFARCESLRSVTIPDGVIDIGVGAFQSCDSLTSVTIPDSVTFIAAGAFELCSGLTSITYAGTVEQWNAVQLGLLWNPDGITEVVCSDGTVSLVD